MKKYLFRTNSRAAKTLLSLAFAIQLIGCINQDSSLSGNTLKIPRFEEVSATDTDFPVSVPKSFVSRRGYLIVKESSESSSQQTISLPVVIIKAKQKPESKKQAPILRLAGGPGISGLNAAAYPGAYPWTSYRDFIIMGQRGTEHTIPALQCPEYLQALNSNDNKAEKTKAAARKCKQRYKALGIDTSAYHSSASAKDIESLRAVLNVEKLSLYAGSYGTRLALTYARDFPDHVESMVLDSPLPHNARYDDESPSNFKLALTEVVNACANNASCSETFPNLQSRFNKALNAAAISPWRIETEDNKTLFVTDTQLALLLNPSSPAQAANIPRIMNAIASRDIEFLKPLLTRKPRSTSFSWGMRLSVWCSESAPYSRKTHSERMANFASINGRVVDEEICDIWDVPVRPVREKEPTLSSVPTLVIAGQFDHLTPPLWGQEVVSTIENSYLAVLPFGGHVETNNWGGDGCAMDIAEAFFKNEKQFLKSPEEALKCLNSRKEITFNLAK